MENDTIVAVPTYSIFRAIRKILLSISESQLIPGTFRYRLLKLVGIKFEGTCFIGSGVSFDTLHPELISIGEKSIITTGCKTLTHFYNIGADKFYTGTVVIGSKCFIGMNTLIVHSVKIGDNVVVGAGSVVTKDIPSGEVWAGNPAKFIRKR